MFPAQQCVCVCDMSVCTFVLEDGEVAGSEAVHGTFQEMENGSSWDVGLKR